MYIGLSHKQINRNGATVLSSGAELIAHELELLLNMPKHSLFFGSDLGLDLEKYLFLSNKQAMHHLIRDDILKVLEQYGKVDLVRLTTAFQGSTLIITLVVRVKTTQQAITIPLTLYT